MTEAEWLACVEPWPMLDFLREKTGPRKVRLCCVAACRHIRHSIRERTLRHSPNDVYELDEVERQVAEAAEARADEGISDEDIKRLPSWQGDLCEFGDARSAEILLATRYGVGISALSYGYYVAEELIEAAFHHCAVDEDAWLLPSFADSEKDRAVRARRNRAEFASAVADYERDFEEAYGRCVLMAGIDSEEREAIKRRGREAMEAESCHHAQLLRDIFGNPFHPVNFSPDWRTDTTLALARQMYKSRDFSAMPILADALQDAGCDNEDILEHCRGSGPHVRGCWVVDLVLGKV